MRRRARLAGVVALVIAVALGALSAGPWGWGLGCALAVALGVWGAVWLADAVRPYDYAKDGI